MTMLPTVSSLFKHISAYQKWCKATAFMYFDEFALHTKCNMKIQKRIFFIPSLFFIKPCTFFFLKSLSFFLQMPSISIYWTVFTKSKLFTDNISPQPSLQPVNTVMYPFVELSPSLTFFKQKLKTFVQYCSPWLF